MLQFSSLPHLVLVTQNKLTSPLSKLSVFFTYMYNQGNRSKQFTFIALNYSLPRVIFKCVRDAQLKLSIVSHCSFPPSFSKQVTVTVINQLLEKIRQDFPGLEETAETELSRKQFENTISHVQLKKESPEEGSPSYEEIKI